MRCAIYTRVSTQEQGREGASLPVQLQACRKHAAAEGWIVVDELQDIQSGLDVDRAAYQQVIGLARVRAIDVVLVWRLDRFGRDDAEAYLRLKELARLQVKVVSATEGEQTAFMQKLMFLLAGEESRRISERVRPMMRQRAQEGRWLTRTPFGYRKNPAKGCGLVPDDTTAPIVRAMYHRADAGESSYSIHMWLNTLTTADGERLRSPTGRWFSPLFVTQMLRNPVYAGFLRWGQNRNSKLDGRYRLPASEHIIVPGQHEPLIDRDLFDRVQKVLDVAAKRKHPQRARQLFLLTGLLTCGECGRALCGMKAYKRNHKIGSHYCYRCGIHSHGRFHGGKLDAYILEQVAALPLPTEGIADVRATIERAALGAPDRAADLVAQRKHHEERRRRLTMHLADGVLTVDDYRGAVAEVEQAMAIVDRELALQGPRADTTSLIADVQAWLTLAHELGGGTLAATLPGASLEDQAALVGAAIKAITLTRGQEPVVTWYPWVGSLRAATAGAK